MTVNYLLNLVDPVTEAHTLYIGRNANLVPSFTKKKHYLEYFSECLFIQHVVTT